MGCLISMIKIHFIINTLAAGGAEKVFCDLIKSLDPQKYSISLAAIAGGVHEADIPCYCVKRIFSKRGSFLERVYSRLPASILGKMLVDKHADINIAYLEGWATKALAQRRIVGKKVAFVHCDVSVNDSFQAMYKTIKKCQRDYSSFDKVCFVSQDALAGFSNIYGYKNNYQVIHNVIDFESVRKKSLEKTAISFDKHVFKVVVVGRLAYPKSVDRVLRLAERFEQYYKFQIIIVGDGPDYEELTNYQKKNNIKSVAFAGYQKNPYPIIVQADILLCTSLFEGYSTVACEALSLGVPLLTTKCAGMKEITQDGRLGIVVDNSETGLARGFEELMTNCSLYAKLKKNAIDYATELQTEDVTKEYDMLFDSVLERK